MGFYRFANGFILSPDINFLLVYNGNMILCWGETDCEVKFKNSSKTTSFSLTKLLLATIVYWIVDRQSSQTGRKRR